MKINVTIDLTRAEVLKAITDAVDRKNRYNYKFPAGCAHSVELVGDAYRVVWGPELDPDEPEAAAPLPATSVETEAESAEETKAQEVAA